MANLPKIELPAGIDWRHWVDRWDQMQEQYLLDRNERFEVILRMVRASQSQVCRVLDLGCGTGTLMLHLLENFPKARIFGIDFDPTLLPLAKERLAQFVNRAKLIYADLRDDSWVNLVPGQMDAVVSTAALHWLKPGELDELYGQIASILSAGGIFLNADHVGSNHQAIQKTWEKHWEKTRNQNTSVTADNWDGFWEAYGGALGLNIRKIHQRVIGGWEGGIEEGMPLSWHFDKLRENGFSVVDCFWRCDTDAIYGGILTTTES